MVSSEDVKTYFKDRLLFVGSALEFATVGGIAGSVTGGVLSYLDKIPFVANASVALGALGALGGFAVPFVRRALGK